MKSRQDHSDFDRNYCVPPRIVEVEGYQEKNIAQVRDPLPAPFSD